MAIKTRLEDMVIGDKIECSYAAQTNNLGTFYNIGIISGGKLIPASSTATPDGANGFVFYFIYVGNDFKGRKLLVADRNIQHSISWDVLNAKGVSTQGGVQIAIIKSSDGTGQLDPAKWKTNIRLLTGGASDATKANSEWDKYIVNGPAPGDNATWNWNTSVRSWTSTVWNNISYPNYRANRGLTGNVQAYNYDSTAVVATALGFRPVLVAESLAQQVEPRNKLLVQEGLSIKTFSNDSWLKLGEAPATEEMFITNGMNDFSTVSEKGWSSISEDAKVLAYTNQNKSFTADLTMHNLYEPVSKSYHGPGIIEAEMEELPVHRKFLIVNANHEECTFKYSLDDGSTWSPLIAGDVIDISSKTGTQLKIQTTMPTETAKLTAISYAWA